MAKLYPTVLKMDDSIESRSKRECVNRGIETSISRLVEIIEAPVNVPRYATCHTSIVATGEIGKAPGMFLLPHGVAIHEETHQIFVANNGNDRVDVFSETGEFISQLGDGQLSRPYGITIHGDSIYVSCQSVHTVSKYSLIEMCRVRRIGGKGSSNGQFNEPGQLTTDPIGRVFIADTWNHRICIHDPDSTISVTSRFHSCHDHLMSKYHVTVYTYCVLMTTRVCTY